MVLLLTVSFLTGAKVILDHMKGKNITFVTEGAQRITQADTRLAEEALTSLGEAAIESKAGSVSREVSLLIGGQKTYDYAQLRRDHFLRQLTTQEIQALKGSVGYVNLLDNRGVAV